MQQEGGSVVSRSLNWDRRFIRYLADLTKPLENLLKKNEKFDWRKEQQSAFIRIKEAFRDAASLFVIRSDRRFGIYVDASRTGLGAQYQYQYQYHESKPDEEATRRIC